MKPEQICITIGRATLDRLHAARERAGLERMTDDVVMQILIGVGYSAEMEDLERLTRERRVRGGSMNTCRFCKADTGYALIKYGVRHYAHADCGLRHFGVEFFDKLRPWQLEQFRYFAAQRAGLAHELIRRIEEVA